MRLDYGQFQHSDLFAAVSDAVFAQPHGLDCIGDFDVQFECPGLESLGLSPNFASSVARMRQLGLSRHQLFAQVPPIGEPYLSP